MKRTFIVLLMLTILSVFAAAQNSGSDADTELALDKENQSLGLKAGSEFYFGDAMDEFVFTLAPLVEYDNSFGKFDVFAKAQYFLSFDSGNTQTFYLEEEVAYNIPFSASTLFFILNNQNNFLLNPTGDYDGVVEPSVLYDHEFKFGNLFGQLGFPIGYFPNADFNYDSYLKLGFIKSGFGIDVTGYYNISPVSDISGYEITLGYAKENVFFAEVEFDLNGKKVDSLDICPSFEFYIDRITLWAEVDFRGIGGEEKIRIEPYIGASYNF